MVRVNYYRVLGLPMDATTSQIKARYKALAKRHHPDHNGSDKAMILINEAYSVLSNPRLRFQYNQSIQNNNKTINKSPHNTSTTNKPSKAHATKPRSNVTKFRKANNQTSRIFGLAIMALVAILLIIGIAGSLAEVKGTHKLEIASAQKSNIEQNNNSLATELKQAQAKVKQEQALAVQYAQQALKEKAVSNENSVLKSTLQQEQQAISRENSLLNFSQQNTTIQPAPCTTNKLATNQKIKWNKTMSTDCVQGND